MLAATVWLLSVVLAALLFCVIALICLPLKFRASFRSSPSLQVHVSAAGLSGYLPYITVFDSSKRPDGKHEEEKSSSERAFARSNTRMFRNAPNLIRGVLGCVKLEYLTGKIEFGFDDPADTGMIFGMLCPLAYGLSSSRKFSLAVKPEFDRPMIAGNIQMVINVVPVLLIPHIFRFAVRSFFPGKNS